MPRDREFKREKKDTRMPARDSHAEERMDTRHGEQDFDLRRARDAPSSGTPRSGLKRSQAVDVSQETVPETPERTGQAEQRYRMRQRGNKYHQRFQEEAGAEERKETQPASADGEPKKTSKLEFTADELPPEDRDPKLTHARRKAERTSEKLEQAEARLPARRKLRMETISDPGTGKAKRRLRFEKEVKSRQAHVKGAFPMRPVKAGANVAVGYAHKKIYQAEDENVGIKAAHRTELVGEAGLRILFSAIIRSVFLLCGKRINSFPVRKRPLPKQ